VFLNFVSEFIQVKMPMQLHRYPTLEDLGEEYFPIFLQMSSVYLSAMILFGDRQWFMMIEDGCKRAATDVDQIMDVREFVEYFDIALNAFSRDLHRHLGNMSWAWIQVLYGRSG
jgi:hypothetical protein